MIWSVQLSAGTRFDFIAELLLHRMITGMAKNGLSECSVYLHV